MHFKDELEFYLHSKSTVMSDTLMTRM